MKWFQSWHTGEVVVSLNLRCPNGLAWRGSWVARLAWCGRLSEIRSPEIEIRFFRNCLMIEI